MNIYDKVIRTQNKNINLPKMRFPKTGLTYMLGVLSSYTSLIQYIQYDQKSSTFNTFHRKKLDIYAIYNLHQLDPGYFKCMYVHFYGVSYRVYEKRFIQCTSFENNIDTIHSVWYKSNVLRCDRSKIPIPNILCMFCHRVHHFQLLH